MTTTPALNDDLVHPRDLDFYLENSRDGIASIPRLQLLRTKSTIAAQSKEIEALRSALEPSAETKAAYSGEFYERIEISNPNFDEDDENEPETLVQQVPVSWTTIKEIMAAIRARTALKGA